MVQLPPPELCGSEKLENAYVLSHRRHTKYIIFEAVIDGKKGVLKVPSENKDDESVKESAIEALKNEVVNFESIKSIFPPKANASCKLIEAKENLVMFFEPQLLPLAAIPSRNGRQICWAIRSVATQIINLHKDHGKIHADLSVGNIVACLEETVVMYAIAIDWMTCVSIGSLIEAEHITYTPLFCSRNMLTVIVEGGTAYTCELDDAESLFAVLLFKLMGGIAPLFLETGETKLEKLLEKKREFFTQDEASVMAWFDEQKISFLSPAYAKLREDDAAGCLKCLADLL